MQLDRKLLEKMIVLNDIVESIEEENIYLEESIYFSVQEQYNYPNEYFVIGLVYDNTEESVLEFFERFLEDEKIILNTDAEVEFRFIAEDIDYVIEKMKKLKDKMHLITLHIRRKTMENICEKCEYENCICDKYGCCECGEQYDNESDIVIIDDCQYCYYCALEEDLIYETEKEKNNERY